MDPERAPDDHDDPQSMLTTSEAADVLGVSVATTRRWAAAGAIPSIRTPGGHRRFRRAELQALVGRAVSASGLQWPDLLLDPRTSVLTLQAHLHDEREVHGSWSLTSERAVFPVMLELYRRCEAGLITPVQRQEAFHRLERALVRFLEDAPVRCSRTLLVLAPPGDRSLVPLIRVALCGAERGWACRCAGAVPPEELRAELDRAEPSGLVVCASLGLEVEELQRWAPAYAAFARRVPTLFVGPWPGELIDGAAHAGRGLGEINGWLDTVAPRSRN